MCFCAACNFASKTIILVWFNLLVVIQIIFWLFGIKGDILNVIINIAKYFDKNSKKRDLSQRKRERKSEMVVLPVPQTTMMSLKKD